ncbi:MULTISPECIES: pentapeptide repeat-containing protein [unclassified Arthrobacter]|uniref:pentapeptide repeat-containing protein n=1 Tax=unclassified Arthrobacter TaxID=235627 RepID=UPI001492A1B5|nr:MULTISPECIES: pentapeptide repeat-containing protein [unclassified Arthrobacter]NOJ64355.1 pentapeptide repeat-containing protein [Arthrobacter sp. 147(2020)]
MPDRRTRRDKWVHDGLLAILVGSVAGLISGGILFVGQSRLDDSRAEREMTAAEELADNAARLENLRYVRDKSGVEGAFFGSLDLAETQLSGLQLRESNFYNSVLTGAYMSGMDLTYSNITGADLTNVFSTGTDFTGSDFSGSNMENAFFLLSEFEGASFTRVSASGVDMFDSSFAGARIDCMDVRGASFRVADLSDATVSNLIHDASTIWPEGFTPPPTVTRESCMLEEHRSPSVAAVESNMRDR